MLATCGVDPDVEGRSNKMHRLASRRPARPSDDIAASGLTIAGRLGQFASRAVSANGPACVSRAVILLAQVVSAGYGPARDRAKNYRCAWFPHRYARHVPLSEHSAAMPDIEREIGIFPSAIGMSHAIAATFG
jgi:hypothetical protein